jgi:hypothetical protein
VVFENVDGDGVGVSSSCRRGAVIVDGVDCMGVDVVFAAIGCDGCCVREK